MRQEFPARNGKASLWCGHPQGYEDSAPAQAHKPCVQPGEDSLPPNRMSVTTMGHGTWHVSREEGLIGIMVQLLLCPDLGLFNRDQALCPEGLELGRRFLQIPSVGNLCEHVPVSDGGDGACYQEWGKCEAKGRAHEPFCWAEVGAARGKMNHNELCTGLVSQERVGDGRADLP